MRVQIQHGTATLSGMMHRARSHSTTYVLCCCLLIMLVIGIPKGGIKVSGVPLTFSYGLLAIIAAPMLLLTLTRNHLSRLHVFTLLCAAPLMVHILVKLWFYGSASAGPTLALIATIVLMPIIFLLALAGPLRDFDRPTVIRVFIAVVAAVALFGLFEFVARNYFKVIVEVPYVTINADDVGGVARKHNDRGNLIKLVSTYQNGNIFGICMLMVGPLFFHFARGLWWLRALFVLAVFLSLSRTAWAGLLVWLLLWEAVYRRRLVSFILRSPIYVFAALMLTVSGVAILATNYEFIFDNTLGGRLQSADLLSFTLAGNSGEFYGIGEMTYLSMFVEFGLAGLLLFLLWLAAPILVGFAFGPATATASSGLERACKVSLMTYWVVAAVDGAFVLIPVGALYWLVAAIMLSSMSVSTLRNASTQAYFPPARSVVAPAQGMKPLRGSF
jgi:hypothetical protein